MQQVGQKPAVKLDMDCKNHDMYYDLIWIQTKDFMFFLAKMW